MSVTWDDNDRLSHEQEKEEEVNLCLMENLKIEEVNITELCSSCEKSKYNLTIY